MQEFSYITKGMVKPQGKQKVYYSAHKDDFDTYLNEVSEDILDLHDCAIFYKKVEDNSPSHFDNLKLMQLMVFPITTKFLFEDNFARNQELQFALKNNIPILPLIQEQNLENEFNHICGDLQCLNKHSYDVTQISFSKKLEDFLSTVLVDDNLKQQIENSFDGHIFLSYRKKDRAYAQQLIQKVHQESELQKLSIWYDEFLIPGEDYSENIEQAIKDCKVFVMAVTPSILEGSNYVLNVEYPLAKKYNKPILPVELLPTSKDELSKLYLGIPTPYQIDDQDYTEVLKKYVSDSQNETDAQQSYFVGLGYLNGCNVEENIELGIKFLERASQQNYIPASQKLASVLYYGNKVSANKERAISLIKQTSILANMAFMQDRSEENFKQLINLLLEHHLFLFEDKQFDIAKAPLMIAFGTITMVCKNYGYESAKNAFITVLEKIGDVESKLNNFDQAERQYYEAYTKQISFAKQKPDGGKQDYKVVARISKKLSDICAQKGDLKLARMYMEARVSILKMFAQENNDFEIAQSYYRSWFELANICVKEGNYDMAKSLLIKSFDGYKELHDKMHTSFSDSYMFWELAPLNLLWAKICLLQNQIEQAEERYMMLQKRLRQLANGDEARYMSLGYMIFGELGIINMHKQNYSIAIEHLTKALCYEDIFAKRSNPEDLHFLITTYQTLCTCYAKIGNTDQALSHLEKSLNLAKQDAEKGTLESKRNLYVCYYLMGEVYQRLHQNLVAAKGYQASIQLIHEIASKALTVETLIDTLSVYTAYANFNHKTGDEPLATSLHQKVFEISKQYIGKLKNATVLNYVVTSVQQLITTAPQDKEYADNLLDTSISASNEILSLTTNPQDRINLANTLSQKATLNRDNIDFSMLSKANQIYQDVYAQTKDKSLLERIDIINKMLALQD